MLQAYYEHLDKMYGRVSTWEDLVDTNLAYVNGKHRSSFYSMAPFSQSDLFTCHKEIVQLHREHGIFVHDGQPGYIDNYNISKRSYISFVAQKDTRLVEHLVSANSNVHAFARIENPDGSYSMEHNCPYHVMLTNPEGREFNLDMEPEMLYYSDALPNVHALLSDAMHVFVALRDFPTKGKKQTEAIHHVLRALEGK
jgi:hypothetical protein